MKNKVKLNKKISLDLPKLISGKLLIQANSGGGKSWLIRRIVEQAYGKVQIIILDPEGEFGTLREKFNFVLAGKDGDTPAEPKSASMLAQRLLELKVSTIIDLYELHPQERKRFVKLFLDSMINAPKKLYHPTLVVLDEAHTFAPERGEAESLSAVVSMASLGRKREFSLILATQRISKLHKDAAAECNNKLIGRASLDIDRKRSADEIGITNKNDILALRSLKPGEFFAFGPAISDEVIKIEIGDVQTSIPKGGKEYKVVPPTSGIKKILGKLADLPEEAKKEATTVKEMKTQIAELKRHRCPKVNSKEDIDKAVKVVERNKDIEFMAERDEFLKHINTMFKVIETIGKTAMAVKKPDFKKRAEATKENKKMFNTPVIPPIRIESENNDSPMELLGYGFKGDNKPLKGGGLRMLKVLVSRYPMAFTKAQLATFSKMKATGGSYSTYLSTLRTKGFLDESGGLIKASELGLQEIGGSPNPPQTSEEIIEMWRGNLKGGACRMFDYLVSFYPEKVTKEELGLQTDISPTGGSFSTYLSMLKSNGLVEVHGRDVKVSDNLFI